MKLRNTIIYLIGIPAVGKYTTAKAIERATGAKVIDNQLINYPIFSIVGYDGTDKIPIKKEAWRAVAKIGNVVRNFIRDHADPDASFVFTNVLNDLPGDRGLFKRIERLAKHRNATFVPVWMSCDADEIRNRKNRPDRRERLKDIDLANIRYWFDEFKLLAVEHPNELRLDTTKSKPDETAKKIVAHARRLARRSDTKLSVRSRFKA